MHYSVRMRLLMLFSNIKIKRVQVLPRRLYSQKLPVVLNSSRAFLKLDKVRIFCCGMSHPINVSQNFWNARSCSGLVRKSTTISSVGQYFFISISPLSTQSLIKKNNVCLCVFSFLCKSSAHCVPS